MKNFTPLDSDTLRSHKGRSFVGITTCFIVHDGQEKIFLTKRSNKTRDEQGRWEYGGGGLKFGASAEENVRREVQEELGAKAQKLEFLGYRDVFRSDDKGPTHWLALDFAVLVNPQEVTVNEPEMIDDGKWFNFDTLPKNLHSQVGGALAMYRPKMEEIWQRANK